MFTVFNSPASFEDPKNYHIWQRPDLGSGLNRVVEDILNERNRYGLSRVYSHCFEMYPERLSLKQIHRDLIRENATCTFFVDHQIARRIINVNDPNHNDRLTNLARAVVSCAPFFRAKIDIFNSALEQSDKGWNHRDYLDDIMTALTSSVRDVAGRILKRPPNGHAENANFRMIILRRPDNICGHSYTSDLANLLKVVQLHRSSCKSNIEKLEEYLTWQISYIVSPPVSILALLLFSDSPPVSIWKDLKLHPKSDDNRIVKNQLIDLQYVHRYHALAARSMEERRIPVLFSDDAALIHIIDSGACGVDEGDAESKLLNLIRIYYKKNRIRAERAMLALKEASEAGHIMHQRDDWPEASNRIFDDLTTWWAEHTGEPLPLLAG